MPSPERLPPVERAGMIAAATAGGLLLAQLVAARALRDALFLSTYPIQALPAIMLASALISMAGAFAFATALVRRSPMFVLTSALIAQSVLFLAEWRMSSRAPGVAAVALYLQLALLGPGLLSSFWSIVNERFDPHTARRVVGPIGTGLSVGGVVGGVLAWAGARLLSVPALLAAMTPITVLAVLALRRVGGAQGREPPGAGAGDTAPLRTIQRSAFLRQLVAIVAVGAVGDVLLDYLLRAGAVRSFLRSADLASFFGMFQAGLALVTLALQAGVTRGALDRWGLGGTASIQPAVVAALSVAGVAFPSLPVAVGARGGGGALRDSLFRSSYELFFTPLPPWQKRRTKALVDIGADKIGSLIGSGVVMLLVALPSSSERWLWLLVFVAALCSVLLTRRLQGSYVSALEQSLRSGVVTLDEDEIQDSTTRLTLTRGIDRGELLKQIQALRGEPPPAPTADPLEPLERELGSGDPERIRTALIEPPEPEATALLVPLLARDDVAPHVVRALRRIAPRIADRLIETLVDPAQPDAVRRRIARVLKAHPSPQAVTGLLQGLDDPDLGVRRTCGSVLASMQRAGYVIPAASVYEALSRELQRSPTDGEGQLDHVFTLLAAVGEPEPLQMSRRALRGDDPRLRGTALEYLNHVLPEAVRQSVLRRIAAAWIPPARPRGLDEVEDDLRRSSSSWSRSRLRATGVTKNPAAPPPDDPH